MNIYHLFTTYVFHVFLPVRRDDRTINTIIMKRVSGKDCCSHRIGQFVDLSISDKITFGVLNFEISKWLCLFRNTEWGQICSFV